MQVEKFSLRLKRKLRRTTILMWSISGAITAVILAAILLLGK